MYSGLLNLKFGWMHENEGCSHVVRPLKFKFGLRVENIRCSHVVRFYTFCGWTLSNTGCITLGDHHLFTYGYLVKGIDQDKLSQKLAVVT